MTYHSVGVLVYHNIRCTPTHKRVPPGCTQHCNCFGGGLHSLQGNHLSGKHGNVRKFGSCQGNVRDFTENQGNVGEKNLVGEKLPKTVYCKLHICVHTGI